MRNIARNDSILMISIKKGDKRLFDTALKWSQRKEVQIVDVGSGRRYHASDNV